MNDFYMSKRFEESVNSYNKRRRRSNSKLRRYEENSLLSFATGLNFNELAKEQNDFYEGYTKDIIFCVCEFKGQKIRNLSENEAECLFQELTDKFDKCPFMFGSNIGGWIRNGEDGLFYEFFWELPMYLPLKNPDSIYENLKNSIESFFSCKLSSIDSMRSLDLLYAFFDYSQAEVIFKQLYLPKILYKAAGINLSCLPADSKSNEKRGA